jgi:hypothetical protein
MEIHQLVHKLLEGMHTRARARTHTHTHTDTYTHTNRYDIINLRFLRQKNMATQSNRKSLFYLRER